MKTPSSEKRNSLVEAAARVVYRQGFHRTTLADIATEAKFPLGNLYYYFKTKEDICEAILEKYLRELRAKFEEWGELSDPRARLEGFFQMIAGNRAIAAKCGCPFGSLSIELFKERASLASRATRLFEESLDWLEVQFRGLGRGKASRASAAHVISVWQGSMFLAQTFQNPELVLDEVKRLRQWALAGSR